MITELEGCFKENGLAESCLSLFEDFTNESMRSACTQSKLEQEGGLLNGDKIMKTCGAAVKKLLDFESLHKACFHFTGLVQLKCFAASKQHNKII